MAISETQKQFNIEKLKNAQAQALKLIKRDVIQEAQSGVKRKYVPTLKESLGMNGMPSSAIKSEMDEYDTMSNDDLSSLDTNAIHEEAMKQPINQNNGVRNTKVPNAILEAFSKNPIDVTPLESNLGMESTKSVLDIMGVKAPKKSIVRESVVAAPTQTQPAVDYALIKTIVEDTMKKMLPSIKKAVLNESVNNNANDLAVMKIANGFKFVDKSGNIYECKLTKIGNVNS